MTKKIIYLASPYGFSKQWSEKLLPEFVLALERLGAEVWEPFQRNTQIDFSQRGAAQHGVDGRAGRAAHVVPRRADAESAERPRQGRRRRVARLRARFSRRAGVARGRRGVV